MRYLLPAFIVAAGVVGLAMPASAQQHDFFQGMKVDWHRVNCWPEPFYWADRDAVRAPFAAMVQAGWRRQNTLGDADFDPQTQQLTEAGRLKLKWILTQTPVAHRDVFVLSGPRQEATVIRMASVQREAATALPPGIAANVFETNVEPRTVSADYIDDINNKARSSTPTPRIAPVSDSKGS